MTENPLAHRLDYTLAELDDDALSASPFELLQQWLTQLAENSSQVSRNVSPA